LRSNFYSVLLTYGAVCLAWVFFRASDFTIATRMLRGMFGGHPHGDAILPLAKCYRSAS
jgi:D-alanyl-lipoteichoic acid acyltransferase DltB (MBOAT superfamily)